MSPLPSVAQTPISTITADPVVRVPAQASVADVAAVLAEHDLGAVVLGDETPPAALISERDVVRVVAQKQDPTAVPAATVATTKVICCHANTTIGQAAVQMMEHYIRHIVVIDNDNTTGIVSARDLLGIYSADSA